MNIRIFDAKKISTILSGRTFPILLILRIANRSVCTITVTEKDIYPINLCQSRSHSNNEYRRG